MNSYFLLKNLQLLTIFLALNICTASAQENELSNSEREQILIKISSLIRENLVVEDLADKTAHGIENYHKNGKYDSIQNYDDLARILTQDLQDLSGDLHLYLRKRDASADTDSNNPRMQPRAESANAETQRSTTGTPRMRRTAAGINFDRFKNDEGKFISFKKLEGEVLHIEIAVFAPLELIENELKEALEASKNASAIIVDLRNCPGGTSQSLEYLAGSFFENETLISTHHTKNGAFDSYSTKTPYGKINKDKPVIALTSERSFSAAEAFAFFMQETGRIKVAGEKTRGGGRTTQLYPVNEHLNISISHSIAISSKGNEFQGVGVSPDFPSSKEQALTVAHIESLELISTKSEEKRQELDSIIEKLKEDLTKLEN